MRTVIKMLKPYRFVWSINTTDAPEGTAYNPTFANIATVQDIPVVYLLFPESYDIIRVKSEQKRSEATSVKRIITKGVTRNETVYYGISV